jgi:hypothetical protein
MEAILSGLLIYPSVASESTHTPKPSHNFPKIVSYYPPDDPTYKI